MASIYGNLITANSGSGSALLSENNTWTGTNDFTANTSFNGDIELNGTGKRFRGDFTNATIADRLLLQTSVTNGLTSVGFIPNGTSTIAGIKSYNNSDPTNAAGLEIHTSSTIHHIEGTVTGTGTHLPLRIRNGGNLAMTIATTGNISLPENLTLNNPITFSDGTYTSTVKTVPYDSVALTGGQTAIGSNAGNSVQGVGCVAIGLNAGASSQVAGSVAIGSGAGNSTQQGNAVAIGINAGQTGQNTGAVAVGQNAGRGTTSAQGASSICIGTNAGTASAAANSICLNATGSAFNPNTASSLFITPIRSIITTGTAAVPLYYNQTSKEIVSSQGIGDIVKFTSSGSPAVTSNAVLNLGTTASIPIGTYIVTFFIMLNTTAVAGNFQYIYTGFSTTVGGAPASPFCQVLGLTSIPAVALQVTGTMTLVWSNTTAQAYFFNVQPAFTGPTITANGANCYVQYTRIA